MPIKECKPEKEKKFITVCISVLTENWQYFSFSKLSFLLVLNNNLNASNKFKWILCFNWKHPSLLDLTKKDPSALVNPINQFLK